MRHAVQNCLLFSMAHLSQVSLRFSRIHVTFISTPASFQSALFLIDYLLLQTLYSLVTMFLQTSPSIVVRLLLVPSPLIYFGFPGQTCLCLLANESAVLQSNSHPVNVLYPVGPHTIGNIRCTKTSLISTCSARFS